MQASSYREAIHHVFADTRRETDEKVTRALELGTEHLDPSIGFLTRIEDGTQEIVQSTGDHELLQPGETCPLDDAYCRRTLEIDGPLAVGDAAVSTPVPDRAVRAFGLGTYLGAKVVVDDAEWIECTVTNDGSGIGDQETAMISEGEETALEHGSGLGLWLVNWIVTRYGGSFQIRSRSQAPEDTDGAHPDEPSLATAPEDTAGTVATVRLPAIGDDQTVESVARRPTVLFR